MHDYKKALEWFDKTVKLYELVGCHDYRHKQAIRNAILLADKVTTGPSNEMIQGFYRETVVTRTGTILHFNNGYDAMIAKAQEEINDGK